MKAYKKTKDSHDQKVQYGAASYLLGKYKVRSKVTLCFPTLDLSFLDVESANSEDEDEEATPKGPNLTLP